MKSTILSRLFAPLLTLALFNLVAVPTHADFDMQREDIQAFVQNMANEHQLDPKNVAKMVEAAESKESILKAMRRPAEKSKPWHEYRKIFLNEKRIKGGAAFLNEHREALEQVAADTGVPAAMMTAIIGVETNYGRLKGSYRVIDALATLAFDYPPRSPFFTKELGQFMLLVREENIDPLTAKGSYAGAMGAPQFMPSSYRVYANDGDNDGQRDLFNNWDDVFASIANYFIGHGWQPEAAVVSRAQATRPKVAERLELRRILPVYRAQFLRNQGLEFESVTEPDELAMVVNLEGEDAMETWVGYQNFYVITRYNRSKMYAMAVLQLSEAIQARADDNN